MLRRTLIFPSSFFCDSVPHCPRQYRTSAATNAHWDEAVCDYDPAGDGNGDDVGEVDYPGNFGMVCLYVGLLCVAPLVAYGYTARR